MILRRGREIGFGHCNLASLQKLFEKGIKVTNKSS